MPAKLDVSEVGWKVIDRLSKIVTKFKVGEVEGEVVHRLIEENAKRKCGEGCWK